MKPNSKNELLNNLSKNWFVKFHSLIIFLTIGVVLTGSAINQKLALSSDISTKIEFTPQEFQKVLIQKLTDLNKQNPEKLALVNIAEYAGQIIELTLGEVLDNDQRAIQNPVQNSTQNEKISSENKSQNRENLSRFNLQNLEFVELENKTNQNSKNQSKSHIIGFVATPKISKEEINKQKSLENLENSTQIGKTIAQNVGGETAKSDYQKYKSELNSFLSNLDSEKPQNLLLSAFAIKMVDGKPDPDLVSEFTKLGYNLIYIAMALEEGKSDTKNQPNTQISFGNVMAIRGKIDNSKISLRVPVEGLSSISKNLNSETIDQMIQENSVLIYANPIFEITELQIDENNNQNSNQTSQIPQNIPRIIGTNYFSFFSGQKMRKANFEQIANYCQTSLTKNSKTQILIMGDFNTMGNIDGRDLSGKNELDGMINQATNFLPNFGSSWVEIANFKLILDNVNFELWQQLLQINSHTTSQKPKENEITNLNKLEYYPSNLPFRGFGSKEIILKMLNLILDGVITNLSIASFSGEFKNGLYKIEYKYFENLEHPQMTIRLINQQEFERIKKEKAGKMAINLAITQIMSQL